MVIIHTGIQLQMPKFDGYLLKQPSGKGTCKLNHK